MPKSKRSRHSKRASMTRWNKGQIIPTEEPNEIELPVAASTLAVSPDRNIATASPLLSIVVSTSATSPQPVASTSTATSPQPVASTSTASPQPVASTSTPSPQPVASTPSPHHFIPPNNDPSDQASLTRSEKKKSLFNIHIDEEIETSPCVRTIVEISQIEKLISNFSCPKCERIQELEMNISRQYGMALKLNIVCNACGETVSSQYTSPRNAQSQSKPQPFIVNEMCTLASLLSGIGSYYFKAFCEYMEMPGLHQKSFNTIAKRLYAKSGQLGGTVFQQATTIVRQEYATHYNMTLNDKTVFDIAVCYDGSWLTRGHKSLIGIGSVIDVLTGLVLDTHVLSLHCQICSTTGAWIKRENRHRYDRWRDQHLASGECTINFEGTSGMMEVKAASVLWERSVERYNLRYTTMVSDGDSKAYNKLLQDQPYGPDIIIDKEDCLNHVGKRLGTALRNLVADCSKRGVTLGGRGHGRLTAEAIRKLQIYFSRAIRANNTAQEMRQAILATIHHGYSTDDWPQHQYCPPGKDSWCFYKRTIAEHHYPAGHKRRVHTPLDYERLHKYLEPIYQRLTSDDLLKRCEKKATQNPSESFHNSVWSKCSKTKFHSLKRVQFAVLAAAAEYNRGPMSVAGIKQTLGFGTGHYGLKFGKAREHQRLVKSSIEAQEKTKRRRKKRAEAREKARQEKEAEEGGPAYQTGAF